MVRKYQIARRYLLSILPLSSCFIFFLSSFFSLALLSDLLFVFTFSLSVSFQSVLLVWLLIFFQTIEIIRGAAFSDMGLGRGSSAALCRNLHSPTSRYGPRLRVACRRGRGMRAPRYLTS
jgi:hypothetical protein